MTDYPKAVGTAGTLIIRDNGTTVEYLVSCSDGATVVGSYTWSGVVNGSAVGGTVSLGAGFGTRSLGSWTVTSSQTVTFHQNATGTQGLGGAADHSAAINRGVPVAPGAPVPLGFTNVTTTSFNYLWRYGDVGSDPITQRVVQYATKADFSDAVGFPVDVSGTVPIAGLQPGVEYYVRVRVQSAAGVSPWSAVTSQRTLGGVYVSDGTTWKPGTVYVSDGTTWKPGVLTVSDGSTWRPTS